MGKAIRIYEGKIMICSRFGREFGERALGSLQMNHDENEIKYRNYAARHSVAGECRRIN
jgi:hypothetical protein